MTPRKVEVPREKPWLCLRTAMMSSSKEMSCMHSVRSAYLAEAHTLWARRVYRGRVIMIFSTSSENT